MQEKKAKAKKKKKNYPQNWDFKKNQKQISALSYSPGLYFISHIF